MSFEQQMSSIEGINIANLKSFCLSSKTRKEGRVVRDKKEVMDLRKSAKKSGFKMMFAIPF